MVVWRSGLLVLTLTGMALAYGARSAKDSVLAGGLSAFRSHAVAEPAVRAHYLPAPARCSRRRQQRLCAWRRAHRRLAGMARRNARAADVHL